MITITIKRRRYKRGTRQSQPREEREIINDPVGAAIPLLPKFPRTWWHVEATRGQIHRGKQAETDPTSDESLRGRIGDKCILPIFLGSSTVLKLSRLPFWLSLNILDRISMARERANVQTPQILVDWSPASRY